MLIETTRLIVRPFREKDADTLYRIKSDPQVMEFCPDFLDVDAKQADMPGYIRAFQRIEESGDTDAWRCYAIESRETGEVLGALTFCKQKMLHEYDLGWMMISSYTGKGYAWYRITKQVILGGTVTHLTVLSRAAGLYRQDTGIQNWRNVPEKYWNLALDEFGL